MRSGLTAWVCQGEVMHLEVVQPCISHLICYICLMVMTLTYPLTIEEHPAEVGYLAYFLALPGCQTWGDTFEVAVHNAEEALTVYIETLAAQGDPIPEPNAIESPISLGVMLRANIET